MDNEAQSHNTKLILLTGEFPYGHTETFLETEIKYLWQKFDEITIVPTSTSGPLRPIPDGVSVDLSYSKKFHKYRKIRSVFSLTFLWGLTIHWKYLYSLAAIRRINSFVSDALITKKWIQKNSQHKKLVVYTYWFNGKTYGAQLGLFNKNRKSQRVVSRAHRYDIYDYWFKPPFWPFRQQSLEKLDRLFLISEDGYNYVTNKYQVDKNICSVSKLGVSDPDFIAERSADDTLRVVSVSGITPVK